MDYWHDVEEAQRNLVAENTRLRADLTTAIGARDLNGQQVLARGVEIGTLAAENARLRAEVEEAERQTDASMRAHGRVSNILESTTADLARVTAERDGLRRAARDVLTSETITPPRSSDAIVLKKWAALRAAVAACAPLASGEEIK